MDVRILRISRMRYGFFLFFARNKALGFKKIRTASVKSVKSVHPFVSQFIQKCNLLFLLNETSLFLGKKNNFFTFLEFLFTKASSQNQSKNKSKIKMQQYMIYAKDGTEAGVFERRLSVRKLHFEGVQVLKDKGNYVLGGALLDDAGKMIGSALILQFEHPTELQNWLDNEPYIQYNVWKTIEIHKFGVPPPK
ncbi:MAG: hypothetical protein RLZZ628_872 [Bacteroidota bacterium]